MVRTQSTEQDYQVLFTDGSHSGFADTPEDKGRSKSGLRPHDLLEAAVASCMNMWIRKYAANQGIGTLTGETSVSLDRSRLDRTVFAWGATITGDLSSDEKEN